MEDRRIGIGLTPLERRREVLVEMAVRADELGYHSVGLPEGWGLDVAVVAAEVAQKTSRIEIATGVMSIWGRSAATTAMVASSLQTLSGGRFALGLGTSTAGLAEGLHDVPFTRPAAALAAYTSKVRALLAGERLPNPVVADTRPLRLSTGPSDVPIYLAAMSPRTMAITGAEADGWIPFFLTPQALPGALEQVVATRPAGAAPLDVRPAVFGAITDDASAARAVMARILVLYLSVMGEVYPRLAHEQGYAAEVAAVRAANASSADSTVPDEAERLLSDLWMYGTPNQVPHLVDRWFEAGASSLAVTLPPGAPREILHSTLEAFAPSA